MNDYNSEFDLVDEIGKSRDMKALYQLKNNGAFSVALHQILVGMHDADPNSLNQEQMNLFLCMHLENAGQSDHILSFLQEWFPQYTNQVLKSLDEIGATKSAIIIRQAVELLPEDGTWFFHKADEKSKKEMSELDLQFSHYPDGSTDTLYRAYAEKNKVAITEVK